ncbi:TnsA endonuclease N-terminal domain-containing protein [Paenibacillus sp. BJ-4]|uniref:TnsA endonuclease N-terminal domain-containing protein n=1 Tax=Paenibacillus sp. BJ-4 TaxID=2878097 RepID=UPI001CF0AE73|nr:TnsA endonuclease N-terminal domain-containing protein [Paenibacillus sp. BJ-4]
MSKIRSSSSIASIQRKIKEGRGQGHFSEYKPWLTVHDVPSIGIVTRILGWKSGRLHHYLSEHFELAHHYQMEWSEQVIDIRKQSPLLPLDKTLYIAQKLGIKHPTDPKNKLPIIMTTDMLLTVKQEESIKFIAHSIKPSNKLTKRVVEKLQIEKEFFKDQKIEGALITERQINYNLVRNVEWLHMRENLTYSLMRRGRIYLPFTLAEAQLRRRDTKLCRLPSGRTLRPASSRAVIRCSNRVSNGFSSRISS